MPLSLPSCNPRPLAAGVYITDAFHRKPLFAVLPEHPLQEKPALVVRSWNEAHALHGDARIDDLNPAYVAALISGNHVASEAPYKRIRRIPRGHHVWITRDGSVQFRAHDPLAGGAEPMEADTLYAFLQQGMLDHVERVLQGHEGAIGCEHSSGLDSNAVLGALVHGLGVAPERLHTWSHEGGGEAEPLQQFRPFHGLFPHQCHRVLPADIRTDSAEERTQHQRNLDVFGAPAQIGGDSLAARFLGDKGCTVLFSGFGGDQALSHNAANVPTDLVAQARWVELVQWMGGRRRALKTGAGRALGLVSRSWAEQRIRRRSRDFCRSDLLVSSLTAQGRIWLAPHLREGHPWEIDAYLPQHQSIRQRVLADWVAVRAEEETRLAAAHGLVKAFPLLDERLIATLLRQDPALFGESAGRGRLLHRRAFAPFLPPFLRDNPTKHRDPEGDVDQQHAEIMGHLRRGLDHGLAASQGWHSSLARYWDLPAIRLEAERVLSLAEPTRKALLGSSQALSTMTTLSGWWQALDG